MRPRAVIGDVAVDRGGCIGTTRETTLGVDTMGGAITHDVLAGSLGLAHTLLEQALAG